MPVLPRAFPDLSSDVPAGPANPGSLGLIAGLSALAFILLLTTIALGILLLYKILRRRKLQELDPPAQEVVIQEAPPSSGPPVTNRIVEIRESDHPNLERLNSVLHSDMDLGNRHALASRHGVPEGEVPPAVNSLNVRSAFQKLKASRHKNQANEVV